ncbi:hypothetical protein HD553DRAFT_325355 [Filobasidium floriforme]|uniref:uncharacterized protein n=1 Tax=Filobasidium floriforme TaxID=5210 RepID=UPI001E8CEB8B|nr:uncharacterized protein HD553DRAFT_325355 [Filobasidium floriforme]KAH8081918.1 hypothetical protein HD553DRAFT_325355 [Filobasidium floriforme]
MRTRKYDYSTTESVAFTPLKKPDGQRPRWDQTEPGMFSCAGASASLYQPQLSSPRVSELGQKQQSRRPMLLKTKYARTPRPLLIHALSLVVVGGDGLSPEGSREQVAREAKEAPCLERERSGRNDCILVVSEARAGEIGYRPTYLYSKRQRDSQIWLDLTNSHLHCRSFESYDLLHTETGSLVNHPESGKPPSAGLTKQDSTASNHQDRDSVVRPHISKGPNRLTARTCSSSDGTLWIQSSKPQIRTKGPHTAGGEFSNPSSDGSPALHRSIVEIFTVRSLNATKPSRVTGSEIGPGDVHLPLERVRLLGRCQSSLSGWFVDFVED